MQLQNITIKEFDGEILHPSLDIKNDILVIGFRYRAKPDEEQELFLIVKKAILPVIQKDFLSKKEKDISLKKAKEN